MRDPQWMSGDDFALGLVDDEDEVEQDPDWLWNEMKEND